ncbi:MAG: helix-turn-helix domain-containing protein [Terriglobales bacterium]
MGTQIAARLADEPQTEGVVHPQLETEATRDVVRCHMCRMVQFRTRNGICRRCREALDAPPPAMVTTAPGTLAPGMETAQASGGGIRASAEPAVAQAIRQCRQQRGLSQRQLAERMRVPRTYVSKIENDKAMPTVASLERMAAAMEISIVMLLQSDADAFMRELLPYLPQLAPRQRGELLEATRRLAQA